MSVQTGDPAAAVRLEDSRKPWLLGAGAVVALIAIVKLAVHLYAGRRYGFFVDELYYLACARHLDWGYVDQPPLIALIAWIGRSTLGDSLAATRLFPALAGGSLVLLTGLIARELGGRRFAQGLAALTVLLAPAFLAMDHFLSMNAFEPLFWMGCALVLIRIVKTGNQKLWLWFGVLAGLGLENKHSMLMFGFGIVLGLLLTPQRRFLRNPWMWAGGGIALLIFLPNLLWNIQHHFPFLELQANIRRDGRNVSLSAGAFWLQEFLALLPLSLPVWLGGLWFFFFRTRGQTVPGAGLGLVGNGGPDFRSESAGLLSVSRVSHASGWRRGGVGVLAGRTARPVAQVGLRSIDDRHGGRAGAYDGAGAAGRNLYPLFGSHSSGAAPHRDA